ncbi:MAG TPA: hypothetical protein VFW40_13885 [Capsulimonadaceae bacterium]|nr:hypothetical protein [Capsulimonadaceae bacterium]
MESENPTIPFTVPINRSAMWLLTALAPLLFALLIGKNDPPTLRIMANAGGAVLLACYTWLFFEMRSFGITFEADAIFVRSYRIRRRILYADMETIEVRKADRPQSMQDYYLHIAGRGTADPPLKLALSPYHTPDWPLLLETLIQHAPNATVNPLAERFSTPAGLAVMSR